MTRRSVSVRIAGQVYRIRSDADEDWLHEVASYVDGAMAQIRDRTGTVDSLDVAMLTCLNLAREVLTLRQRLEDDESELSNAEARARVKAMICLVESTLDVAGGDGDEGAGGGSGSKRGTEGRRGQSEAEHDATDGADLLTLPAGADRADGPVASSAGRKAPREESEGRERTGKSSTGSLGADRSSASAARDAG